jgi:hypothetical protein
LVLTLADDDEEEKALMPSLFAFNEDDLGIAMLSF